jgi:amino acid transporter
MCYLLTLCSYVGLLVFAVTYFGWKWTKKTKIVKLENIDFVSGRRELDEMEAADQIRYKPETLWHRIMSIVF